MWGNIFKNTSANHKSVIDILKKVPIFWELKNSELKDIEQIIHHRHFKPNEIIFWEGEPGVGMYIIQDGEVAIYHGKDTENEEEMVRLKNGDFFGEMALLNEEPRSGTAVSKANSHIIGLYRPDLFGLFERKPNFGVKVLIKLADMMATRLRNTNEELQELKLKFNKKEVLL